MDPKINKRKQYINISKSSSGEIYAMLDEVESDLEDDIDQLVNDSDTELVADEDLPEYLLQLSNNIVLTPEANIHSLPKSKSILKRRKKTKLKRQLIEVNRQN